MRDTTPTCQKEFIKIPWGKFISGEKRDTPRVGVGCGFGWVGVWKGKIFWIFELMLWKVTFHKWNEKFSVSLLYLRSWYGFLFANLGFRIPEHIHIEKHKEEWTFCVCFAALSVNYDLTRWVVTIWRCNVPQPNHLWYLPWKPKTIKILLPNSGWLRFPTKEIVFSEHLFFLLLGFMSWPYQSWCLGIGRRWFSVSNLGGAHLMPYKKCTRAMSVHIYRSD